MSVTTEADDRYARLAAETERDFPESWRPSPGDVLVGEYVRRDTGTSSYDGSSVPILVLRDRDGKDWGIWCFHAVLRQQLAQQRPRVGEIVALRYAGKRKGQSGGLYHDWRVAVEREQSGEWDVETEPGEDDAAADFVGKTTIASRLDALAAPASAQTDDIPF